MNSTAMFAIVYGVITFIGGIIGYIVSASIPSLAMGCPFGIVLVGGGFGMLYHKKWGFSVTLLSTLILTVFFIYRFILTMKAVPSGIMIVFSLIMLALLFRQLK